MARPLRIALPDAWYHVMSRGNGGQRIFLDDDDRRNFLGLVAELPGRFSLEIHAFVLMENHFHLLLRTREANLSHAIRWLNLTYTMRFNLRHRRQGHLVQGRFKAVLIRDESRLDEVARYLHLNPVRIDGLGLGKEDVRRARMTAVADPGAALVQRRLATLRDYAWSSWRVYSAADASVPWLDESRIGPGCGGRGRKEQRRALRDYTEAPIRQGRVDSPWEALIGGIILGEEAEARRLLGKARSDLREQPMARRVKRTGRPGWKAIVKQAESLLGRPWLEMSSKYGDWGRDAVIAVALRHLGWRLTEVVREVPGLKYPAAAQAAKRFWLGAEADPEKMRFVDAMRRKLSTLRPLTPRPPAGELEPELAGHRQLRGDPDKTVNSED